MSGMKYNKKKNEVTLELSGKYLKSLKTPEKSLAKAAKRVVKDIEHHFRTTKKAWPLSYSLHVQDVFYVATGHYLENYILKELFKKKNYVLKSSKSPYGGLVIDKVKNARSNSKIK